MDELLARVVAPVPSYETRDKVPPPPEADSGDFMMFYRRLEREHRGRLLERLSGGFGVDHRRVAELCGRLADTQSRDPATVLQAEDRLRYALTPRYRQLLNGVSRADGGVKFLVDLRADLLELMASKNHEGPNIRVTD